MAIQEFQTILDPEQYFKGLARQEMDFHQALGELVDNALSARHPMPHAEGFVPITIEVTVEHLDGGNVLVQVADHGVGIRRGDILERVFNPGGQGTSHGALNEHGFGLKNALALLTGGNSTDFDLYSRTDEDGLEPDQFLHVAGPLSTTMRVNDDATRDDWSRDLHHLTAAATGTKIRVAVNWRYFRTIYRRGAPGFDVLAARLAEHLGVMHRYFLEVGNQIRLAYRRAGSEWTHHVVPPIHIPYEGEKREVTRDVTVDGQTYTFTYSRGTLDYRVKDPEAQTERGWPYPIRSYYQGSNARCGIDIVVRDRVIKSGVFEEIWPDIGKTVDFNRFVGEIRVGEQFRTTNNKTGLDPHGENWEEVLRLLGSEEEFRPEKTTRSETEESLRDKLVLILEGTFSGATAVKNRSVWGGGVDIDIFLDAGENNVR
jgi:Histidine kinase-, DNA gyrase B-, and HSP90-like ATPase